MLRTSIRGVWSHLGMAFRRNGPAYQFVRFGIVGAIGFVVDLASLLFLLSFGIGPYAGRLFSYLLAATTTWFLNRAFTFGTRDKRGRLLQWFRFVTVNLTGGAINYGVYSIVVSASSHERTGAAVGVALGSIAGLAINFTMSRWLVFRKSD